MAVAGGYHQQSLSVYCLAVQSILVRRDVGLRRVTVDGVVVVLPHASPTLPVSLWTWDARY